MVLCYFEAMATTLQELSVQLENLFKENDLPASEELRTALEKYLTRSLF